MAESEIEQDLSNAITLPLLEFGYPTVPCPWDELVNIIVHGKQRELAKLSRSKEQQYNYEVYKQNTLLEWYTMTDYVLYTKFPTLFQKVECSILDSSSSSSQRWKVYPSLETINATYTALVKNDFPYYMEAGIEHWILWKLGGEPINDDDITQAKEELSFNHNIQKDYIIHWCNPKQLKSIPNIEHEHFLARVD
jgi:Protein of unknown function (DUF3605)